MMGLHVLLLYNFSMKTVLLEPFFFFFFFFKKKKKIDIRYCRYFIFAGHIRILASPFCEVGDSYHRMRIILFCEQEFYI
jgi:hypothetical protein